MSKRLTSLSRTPRATFSRSQNMAILRSSSTAAGREATDTGIDAIDISSRARLW